MTRTNFQDLDFIAARLHGRWAGSAEVERLDALCRLRTIPELARAVCPGADIAGAADLQRRLAQDLAQELCALTPYLSRPQTRLLSWMLVRFQVENLKVMIRGGLTKASPEDVRACLLALPRGMELDLAALEPGRGPRDLIGLLPDGRLREGLREAVLISGEPDQPFFYEMGLDCGYLRELLDRADELPGEDRAAVSAMLCQEADIFHLGLLVRGRFLYGLKAEALLPWHMAGTAITRQRLAAMLEAPDLGSALGLAVRHGLDALPPAEPAPASDAGVWEALAWKRFLRLADEAFRRSAMGFGVVAGYTGIRRVEVANLITLCEGIRLGVAPEAIRPRLIPRAEQRAAHV